MEDFDRYALTVMMVLAVPLTTFGVAMMAFEKLSDLIEAEFPIGHYRTLEHYQPVVNPVPAGPSCNNALQEQAGTSCM